MTTSDRYEVSVSAKTYSLIQSYALPRGLTVKQALEAMLESDPDLALIAVRAPFKERAQAHATKQGLTTSVVVELAIDKFTRRG